MVRDLDKSTAQFYQERPTTAAQVSRLCVTSAKVEIFEHHRSSRWCSNNLPKTSHFFIASPAALLFMLVVILVTGWLATCMVLPRSRF